MRGNDLCPCGNGEDCLPARQVGAAGRGNAYSVAAIDSAVICVGPLGALPTQVDMSFKTTDFLFVAQLKRTKSDMIWTQNVLGRWRCPYAEEVSDSGPHARGCSLGQYLLAQNA
jgi:hypothetical protein